SGQGRHTHRLSGRKPRRRIGATSIHPHLPGTAQLLDRPLGQPRKVPTEPAIQADIRFVLRDDTASLLQSLLPFREEVMGRGIHYNGIASNVSILSLSNTTIRSLTRYGVPETSIRSRYRPLANSIVPPSCMIRTARKFECTTATPPSTPFSRIGPTTCRYRCGS